MGEGENSENLGVVGSFAAHNTQIFGLYPRLAPFWGEKGVTQRSWVWGDERSNLFVIIETLSPLLIWLQPMLEHTHSLPPFAPLVDPGE